MANTKVQRTAEGKMIPPNAGKGRVKGTPNKSTAKAREAIAVFVDGNAERLQGWLEAIADDPKYGPKTAFDCFMQVAEYHVPKLARTEHVGDGGGAIEIERKAKDEIKSEIVLLLRTLAQK